MSDDIHLLEAALNEAECTRNWHEADRIYNTLKNLVEVDPAFTAAHAKIIFNMGDVAKAATMTRRAHRRAPDNISIMLQLANIYSSQQRIDAAEEQYRNVLAAEPDSVEAMRRLALLLQESGKDPKEAEDLIERVVELVPDDVQAWLQLGALRANENRRYEGAEIAFLKALELSPESASALHNYGLLKRFQGELDVAVTYLQRACELYPHESDFAFSLGSCYLYMEDMETALSWFNKAIEIDPKNNPAQVYKSFALFHLERYDEAWQQYEKRLTLKEFVDANYERPRWHGEDISGMPLLLLSEQGMGDNLQFVRYAETAAARGAKVILMTHKPLIRLFQSLRGVTAVVNGIPEARNFHRYSPLMSLPLVFGTGREEVPDNVPYLKAPADLIATWRDRLSSYSGFKVGLCWRGNSRHVNDKFRSSSLGEMSVLLDIPGCAFFSLHKERPQEEQRLPENLIDIGSDFEDFADTAAAMEALDLVISVDTSVCHVAGATGCKIWTLIARGPDFRWGLKTDKTAWYPTMTLYRQDKLGDWSDVYEKMREDLTVLSASS
jgi:tetratricopeptide (TPR) repeat protein